MASNTDDGVSSHRSQKSSTPIKKKTGSIPICDRNVGHIAAKHQMAHEVFDELLGGMPVSDFMDEFLPLEGDLPAHVKDIDNKYFAPVPSTRKAVSLAAQEEDGIDVEVEEEPKDDVEDEDCEEASTLAGQSGEDAGGEEGEAEDEEDEEDEADEDSDDDEDEDEEDVKKAKEKKARNRRVLEKHMYKSLIPLIRKANVLARGLDAFDTSGYADQHSDARHKWKPDISFYATGSLDSGSFALRTEFIGQSDQTKDKKTSLSNRTYFDLLQLAVELKTRKQPKPFEDPPRTYRGARRAYLFQVDSKAAQETRGQLMTVLTEMCARQHRTHVFMPFIGDPEVRLIRADRAGIIVSEAFNLRKQGKMLAQFLYRFSKLSDVDRGFDPTVHTATPAQEQRAHEILQDWKPNHDRPVVVIDVPDQSKPGGIRQVLAWGSLSDPDSLTGRATRGYPVCDLEDGTDVYFLKDTWRPDVDEIESECQILKELNDAGVRHIPKLICGGDVTGQKTRTQEFFAKDWCINRKEALCGRQHHRLLEDFTGKCIKQFETPLQMMEVVRDAFIAHRDAYEYGFLHRDISDNNVRIWQLKDGRFEGVLSDWDLAIRVKEKGTDKMIDQLGGRQSFRTGTWYFMSSALLRRRDKLHGLQDDLESFFYLIIYVALSHLPFELARPTSLTSLKNQIFRECFEEDTGAIGGHVKASIISHPEDSLLAGLKFVDNKPLSDWVDALLDALKERQVTASPLEGISLLHGDYAPSSKRERLLEEFKTLKLYDHAFFVQKLNEVIALTAQWPDNRRAPSKATKKKPPRRPAPKSALKRSRMLDDDEYRDTNPKSKRSRSTTIDELLTSRPQAGRSSGRSIIGSTTCQSGRQTRSTAARSKGM